MDTYILADTNKVKHRKNCESCQSKVTWKVKFEQGCISCGTCSYPELTEDHVLTSAYVKIFRIVTRNAVNKSF